MQQLGSKWPPTTTVGATPAVPERLLVKSLWQLITTARVLYLHFGTAGVVSSIKHRFAALKLKAESPAPAPKLLAQQLCLMLGAASETND